MTARYAVYFAPRPDSELWRLASAVIGRDAVTGADLPFPPVVPCDAPDWRETTAEPRRYGFHATLKAPFELATAADERSLLEAAGAFAADRRSFSVPRLVVRLLGDFVALTPEVPSSDIDRLGADCVVAFEPFRAPISDHDRERRVRTLTDPRHVASVDRWGYPWVFEDFRFHMTLTGRLPDARRDAVRSALADLFGTIEPSLHVDAVALFKQSDRSGPFVAMERFSFGAA